jgi:GNAT superfamily N-acetyltransferase
MYRCDPAELHAVLTSSWAVVSAYDGEVLVGSGRVMSDGILYAVIFDMVVSPSHQGRGIGSEILKRLLARCEDAGIRDILLFSAKGLEGFYRHFGFVPRPDDAPGMILRRVAARGDPADLGRD